MVTPWLELQIRAFKGRAARGLYAHSEVDFSVPAHTGLSERPVNRLGNGEGTEHRIPDCTAGSAPDAVDLKKSDVQPTADPLSAPEGCQAKEHSGSSNPNYKLE